MRRAADMPSTADDRITVNGAARPWTAQSLQALVAAQGIAPERGGVAVARNGAVVPRADWDSTAVRPGDRIEIVHIVRGG